MKSAADYKSPADILNAPELSAFHKAKLIDEHRRIYPEQPPPTPRPDGAEERTLQEIAQLIAQEHDAWFALDAKQKKYSALLPGAVENFRAMESGMEPDAPAEMILEMLVAGERVKFMQAFLYNVSQRKEAINRNLIGLFHRLNAATVKFTKQQHFLSGTDPAASVSAALACIEIILKK